MTNNNCPFRDAQNRCTHKLPSVYRRSRSKLPICIFNNETKCKMYKEWLRATKLIADVPRVIREEIYEGHKQ